MAPYCVIWGEGAKVMRNKWITMKGRCISCGDQTDRHKDVLQQNLCSLLHDPWCLWDFLVTQVRFKWPPHSLEIGGALKMLLGAY